jgi:hypothetical protein
VAGAWIASGGLALAAAGLAAGLHGRTLERRLSDRFEAGTLAPSDRASYGTARRWGTAANLLFATGGLLSAAGVTVFALAPAVEPSPEGGVTVGLAGRF